MKIYTKYKKNVLKCMFFMGSLSLNKQKIPLIYIKWHFKSLVIYNHSQFDQNLLEDQLFFFTNLLLKSSLVLFLLIHSKK